MLVTSVTTILIVYTVDSTNSAKNKQILIIFGAHNPDEISHQKVVNSPTSPE